MKKIVPLLIAIIAISSIFLSSGFNNFPDNEKEISKHIEIKTASEDSLLVVREFWDNPDYMRMKLSNASPIQIRKNIEKNQPVLLYSNSSWLSFINGQVSGSWKYGYSSYINQSM